MTGGYVRLYRSLLENPIWKQLAPAVGKVAIHFLMSANYQKKQWYDGKRTIDIPAGSFITSYKNMAEACNLSMQQVRDAFFHLSRTQFATYIKTNRWTMVTVLNWLTYQASPDDENTQETRGETTQKNTQETRVGTTTKEVEEVRSKNDRSNARAACEISAPLRTANGSNPNPEDLIEIRDLLFNWNNRCQLGLGVPDIVICEQTLAAGGGNVLAIRLKLQKLWDAKKRPRSYGWFPAVLKKN